VRRYYGITVEEYEAFFAVRFAEQEGACAACGEVPEKLHVDHDDSTGELRALLCPNCNMALGLLKEDPDLLRRLALYADACRERRLRRVS